MKSYIALPLLASFALAQSQADGPNCGIITNPPLDDDFPASTKPIAAAIVAINSTTVALNQSINAFDGSVTSIVNIQAAANAVLANINGGIANTTGLPANGNDDDGQIASLSLASYVGGLACSVNSTIDNLIDIKAALVDACVGPIALDNIQKQQAASLEFEATVREKISPELQSSADILVEPINVALASGIAAYADQTTLPASCAATSSTTATATGTATGGANPTGTAPIGGNGGWQAYGSYSTTGAHYVSAIPSGHGPQPTYGSTPSGGYSWTPVDGDDYDDDECVDDEPEYSSATWAVVTSGSYGPKPTAPVSQGWQVVTGGSTGPKPTYSASSGWEAVATPKPWSATNTTWTPYKGAASGNMANGMGAAAMAIFAAAALL